ncbi:MAG TPA: tRNA 2-thiocytidine biosynthesis TtcA family protein [Clostridia bacterium]|nr:tRNA 2-thiocytidine biosynthesis TtcA family protein [Clostridia bacterium]
MKKPYTVYVLPQVKRAVYEYEMISEGDVIAVGMSGGKDSMALLHLLIHLKRKIPINFTFKAFFVHLGWDVDYSVIESYCHGQGIEFNVVDTSIGEIVFKYREERSPCALCSKLRRGALNDAALEKGCNKVSLGHHLDDLLETYFMSLFYTGQMRTFQPRTYLDRTGITVIRPMIFLTKNTIETLVSKENIPFFKNPCPVDGTTKREEARELIEHMSDFYPRIRENFLTGIKNLDPSNLWGVKGNL